MGRATNTIHMRECEVMKGARTDLERVKLFSPSWWKTSGIIANHMATCQQCQK